ncbi:MAG: hypothetical protein ACTSVY_01685, partial [Candidatus Helarchaeota archaeon]
GKNNGTVYTEDIEGLGATWPSVGGGESGNPVIFAWMRDDGGVGIMYQNSGGDTTSPILVNGSNDMTIELGSSGNKVLWTWTDSFPDQYKITRNGTIINSGTWSNNIPIIENVDGLGLGTWEFIITVNDTTGNFNSDTVLVTVEDTTEPNIISAPSDFVYELGTIGNTISWTWTDLDANQYTISRNGTSINSSTWTSGVAITENIDGLGLGTWEFIIMVNDTTGNFNSDTVLVTVEDTTAPNLPIPPSDLNYQIGATGNNITWNWIDLAANEYIITRNGTIINSSCWVSNVPIIENIDGLAVGYYEFICYVNDTRGNWASDLVGITVTSELTITNPPDDGYEIGETGTQISWTASTINLPDKYNITRNGTLVQSGTWISGNSIIINVEGLGLGVHEFICSVNTTLGESKSDLVYIIVNTDSTSPSIAVPPSDFGYELDTIGNTISWTWTDTWSNQYTITRNGTAINSSTWTSSVAIIENIDGLGLGTWEFIITVNDTTGNFNSDTVLVTVEDTTKPNIILAPSDFVYELGTIGNTISWTWTDLDANQYTISRNGTSINSSTWTSGVAITENIDGLSLGTWEFIITVNDTTGNPNSDTVFVTVEDTIAPKFENISASFPDKTVYGVQHDYQFNCTWLDISGITVYFNLNDTYYLVEEKINDEYFISFQGLESGFYTYNWIAYDEYFNNNDTMNIQTFEIIFDSFAPTFLPPQLENNASIIEEGEPMNISIRVYDGEFTSGIQMVVIYYSTNLQDWNFSLMVLNSTTVINESTGEIESSYIGIIQGQFKVSKVYYYIEIVDNQGNDAETSIFEIEINYTASIPPGNNVIILIIVLIAVGAVSSATIITYNVKKRKHPLGTNKKSKFHGSKKFKKAFKPKMKYIKELNEILIQRKGSIYIKRINEIFPKKKQFILNFF